MERWGFSISSSHCATLVAAVSAALMLASCSGSSDTAEGNGDTYVVGLLSDTSGPAASCCGVPGRAGAELALKQLNEAGGIDGVPVEFEFNDTQGAKEQAVRLYRRLAGEAVAFVGPTRTDEVLTLAATADQEGVPFVSTGSRGPFPGDFGSRAFRIAISEEQLAGPLAEQLASTLDIASLAVIAASDDPALAAGAEALVGAGEEAGMEVVAQETFTTGDTDYSAQVAKIASAGADAVAIAAQADDGGLIVAELARAGVDAQLVGLGGMASSDWFEVAGGNGEGLLTATPFDPSSTDPAVVEFVEAFQAETGELPNTDAACGYAAATVVFEAISRAAEAGEVTPESVSDELGKMTDVPSVIGPVTYDGPGDRAPLEETLILQMQSDGSYAEWTP